MKYKNLLLAFWFEIIFGAILILLTILIGPYAVPFLALFVARPLLLEKEEVASDSQYFAGMIKLLKRSIVTFSVCIIAAYLIIKNIESFDIYHVNGVAVFCMLVSSFIFLHGLLGVIWFKRS